MIKAVLFDKDGCLLDFDKTWGRWTLGFLRELAQGREIVLADMCAAVGFDPVTSTFARDSIVIAGTPEQSADLILPMLPLWEKGALVAFSNERSAQVELEPVVPLAPLLAELRAMGLQLGVATNDAESSAVLHMAKLGVVDAFELILGFDSGFGGKPEPGMMHAFARHTGLLAGQIVMVGDSLHDLHAGRAAGMRCVGVLTGPARAQDLEAHADAVLPDISGLPAWIAAQNVAS